MTSPCLKSYIFPSYTERWRRGGVVMQRRTFDRRVVHFEARFVSSFLGQETLLHIASLYPGVKIGTGDILLEVTLRWTS